MEVNTKHRVHTESEKWFIQNRLQTVTLRQNGVSAMERKYKTSGAYRKRKVVHPKPTPDRNVTAERGVGDGA